MVQDQDSKVVEEVVVPSVVEEHLVDLMVMELVEVVVMD